MSLQAPRCGRCVCRRVDASPSCEKVRVIHLLVPQPPTRSATTTAHSRHHHTKHDTTPLQAPWSGVPLCTRKTPHKTERRGTGEVSAMAPLSPLCLPCPHATHKRHHMHTTQHAHKRLIDRHARFPPRRRSRPHIRPSRLRTVTPPRFGTAALIQSHQPAIPLSPITRGTLSPPLLSVDSPPRALSPCATLGRDLWALRCGPARPHEGHEGEAPRPSLSLCVCRCRC